MTCSMHSKAVADRREAAARYLYVSLAGRRRSEADAGRADKLPQCREEVYLSALSAWEIAIKHRLGRLPLPEPPARYVASRRSWLRLEPLAFDEACAAHDALLPPHHRDPFDRDLVSQAILNGMTIVTPDAAIALYPAPILW